MAMELRHLRYFVAVAEEGSVTLAAERRLHTAQPSLSRQLRDLEREVGAALLQRSARGVTLTEAGQAFLAHARLALAHADAAGVAARQLAAGKSGLAVGFLTGSEVDWLPVLTRALQDDWPGIELRVTSGYSPVLAEGVRRGELDVAVTRRELRYDDLASRVLAREELFVALPAEHRLARRRAIAMADLAGEALIGMSGTAPVLADVIERYLRRVGAWREPAHRVDNLAMAMSLITSTRGVALLPALARHFLPATVVGRPMAGERPSIELVVAYREANRSPVLRRLLARLTHASEASAAADKVLERERAPD